jgi:8-oxo-dGTP diphosphatase
VRGDHATILFVRHAKAGDRTKWEGPDDRRPLSKPGRRQAEALAEHLAAHVDRVTVRRIVSSPSLRCVQTVEPLAEHAGIALEEDHVLAEGETVRCVPLLAAVPDGTVLCSHGDVIYWVLDRLAREGTSIKGEELAKGSTWVLERAGTAISYAWYVPPP